MMRASVIITALLISVTTAWEKSLEFDDCWGINYAYEGKSYKLVWNGDHKTSTCKVTFHGYDQSEVLNKYKICIRATTWDVTHDGVTLKYYSDEDVLTDDLKKEFDRYSYSNPMTEWCSDPEDYVDVQLTTAYANNQGSITLEIYAKMTFEYSKVVGAIVGGVIGGIALISIIVTVIIVVTCRRRKGQGGTVLSNNQNTAGITTVPQYGQPPMQGVQGNTAYNAPPPAYNVATNYSYPGPPPPQGYTPQYSDPVPYQQTTTQPMAGVHQ